MQHLQGSEHLICSQFLNISEQSGRSMLLNQFIYIDRRLRKQTSLTAQLQGLSLFISIHLVVPILCLFMAEKKMQFRSS